MVPKTGFREILTCSLFSLVNLWDPKNKDQYLVVKTTGYRPRKPRLTGQTFGILRKETPHLDKTLVGYQPQKQGLGQRNFWVTDHGDQD
jgi:hypothetical protein